jgi:serine/threonine-protein kinase RsbW
MNKPLISENSIRIPSSEDYLPDVDEFLEGHLEIFGLDKSMIADIAISVTELVNNAICHANKSNPEKTVTVEIQNKEGLLEISITDQGEGFNPDTIENPIEDKNLLKEVGRGIFIVKSLMDSLDYDFSQDRGTTVTITKQI